MYAQTVGENDISKSILTYDCNGWDKDIWLYGDSYFNLTEDTSWICNLLQDGADDIMLSACSGKNSQSALADFKNDITYGTPKMVVWCMGMNDGDCEHFANLDWQAAVEEVMDICRDRDIELILATIPTNPYWNNNQKNIYVQESGYRYIDFADAVGAYESITWYDGMLEEGENRIHPTTLGARALYEQALATLPELLAW